MTLRVMDYKATLNLPKTAFPMKANLPKSEPEMLAWWESFGIYKRVRQAAASRPLWILHDGPPYANGHLHLGTMLNKVLKDVIVKSRSMSGFNAVYVPGWDCHGLPIEHQVDKELGLDKAGIDVRNAMDPVEKRRKCREYALRFIDIQRSEFKRLGVFGDWDNPYITMEPAYQAVIAREFGRFVGRGLVYKGLKPVHWCMHCRTALAQAEVEYEDQRTPSVWVKFPMTSVPSEFQAVLGDEVYVVARALMDDFLRLFADRQHTVLASVSGDKLVGHGFRHPWIAREGTIAAADFVGVDQGTGLVHIAPGHGEEDYELGKSLGLKIYNPVDDAGRFVADVEHFAGLTVWDANPKIIEHLTSVGMLIAQRPLDHTYPHCWRCKNPTLFRATEQWFIDLNKRDFRAHALEAIKRDVQWIPSWGEDRIYNMVAHRLEWVVSRQRVWGVPIVAFYCTGCETLLLEERIVEHVAAIFRQGQGADEWYARSARDLLPPGTRCAKCGGESFRKELDILDVWFDSGCSHAAVLESRPELHWPAELYLEGSDQHRGWFQSSLLESIGTRDAPPYKSVVTHGFFVDGEGRKMSKSLGNVITLDELLPKYGAEVLRLWVAAEDYTQDIRVSPEILDRLADAYRRMRNTFRFLLGNLGDYDPARDRQSHARLDEVDRWVLDRLARLIGRVRRGYDEYEFHTVFHSVHNFCAVDLSALYLDIIKDRLYTSLPDDPRRRAAQTVCYDVFSTLARLLAPILTFTCEEAWRHLPGAHGESVHLERFPEAPREWLDDTLKRDWDRLLEVRREVAKALETARAGKLIGSGLEAAVRIAHAPEDLPALLSAKRALLPTVFIVSRVALGSSGSGASVTYESQDIPGLVIGVDRARGEKCERCWTRSEHVGENRAHPTLCERCVPIVTRLSGSGDPR
jgi:isoleucyl-tRNA synthetase